MTNQEMSFARRLSTIKLRNPLKRRSRASRSRSAATPTSVIEEAPLPVPANQKDESKYRPIRNGPKRKSMCYCCEKRFSVLENFLSLGTRKCVKCQRKICKSCANVGGCHVCAVKKSLDLNPDNLMRVEAKELVAILNTLHFKDANFNNYPKQYLVKQLFVRLEVRPDWDPSTAIPLTEQTDQHDTKLDESMPAGSRVENGKDPTVMEEPEPKAKMAEGSSGKTEKGKEVDEEQPESSKVEEVRRKKQEEQQSKDDAAIPNEDLCKICMDSRVNCILLNCGHFVTCLYCSQLIKKCPICRKTIVRIIKAKKT